MLHISKYRRFHWIDLPKKTQCDQWVVGFHLSENPTNTRATTVQWYAVTVDFLNCCHHYKCLGTKIPQNAMWFHSVMSLRKYLCLKGMSFTFLWVHIIVILFSILRCRDNRPPIFVNTIISNHIKISSGWILPGHL